MAREAIVFDLDGTLTETEAIWDKVRRRLAAQDGRPWPATATVDMIGMSTQEWSAYLSDVVGLRGDAEDARRRTLAGMLAEYREHLPVMPGAVATLRRLHERWPLGLATSAARVLIDAAIATMGVADLFDVTVTSEELGGIGKPAPDVYLEACRLLDVEPARAVAVEDATAGIQSARAAGMAVIAVPPAFSPPPDDVLAQADAVVASLEEITPELVERLVRPR